MPKKAQNGAIWAYLDASGVLEKGTEEEIKAAKKSYWKRYILNYRRNQRITKPEFIVWLSKSSGDYFKISIAAKQHRMAITTFLRAAALSYINKTYILPDRIQVMELKQLLSQCLNEIQSIVKQKEKYFWGKEQKFKDIEKRIEKLEYEINMKLAQPFTLEELIKKEIEKEPTIREHLLAFLNSYDNKNQIT
jgi:hypothetical protein